MLHSVLLSFNIQSYFWVINSVRSYSNDITKQSFSTTTVQWSSGSVSVIHKMSHQHSTSKSCHEKKPAAPWNHSKSQSEVNVATFYVKNPNKNLRQQPPLDFKTHKSSCCNINNKSFSKPVSFNNLSLQKSVFKPMMPSAYNLNIYISTYQNTMLTIQIAETQATSFILLYLPNTKHKCLQREFYLFTHISCFWRAVLPFLPAGNGSDIHKKTKTSWRTAQKA